MRAQPAKFPLGLVLVLVVLGCQKSASIQVTTSQGASATKESPKNGAVSLSFTDTDSDSLELSGTLTITKASSESDVTGYVLYWGSDASTKQSTTPIATFPATGANLTHTFAANTAVPVTPTPATHFLVRTTNSKGEMNAGISQAFLDLGSPTVAATSASFADVDTLGGQLSGTITITKSSDESNITEYVLYWGSSATVKLNSTPITTLATTGENLTYTFPPGTLIPERATHILIFTRNAKGEMPTGIYVPIVDAGVPAVAAASIGFTDTDADGGQIAGALNISKASSEAGITHYVIYWGSSSTVKQSATPVATIASIGANVTYTFATDTIIPTSPAATHLLVYTKNIQGEMGTGTSILITDAGVPTHAAANIAFTDTDTDGGQLTGTVTITKAADESDVTHYALYWGSSSTVKQSGTAIATIAVTGANVTHNFGANTAIPSSPSATHLLVYTKNAGGEMATGFALAITDVGVPTAAAASVAFTDSDSDGGQISGAVTVTKAASETDMTHYVLYWGSDATTKQNATAIANLAVTGANVTHTFAANTAIPTGPAATHLLVFTKNSHGEMATGVSVAITDVGVPTNAAAGVAFTDSDTDAGEIAGAVTITKAASEANITHYVLYWGSDATTKQNATAIANLAVTGANVTHTFVASTAIPSSPAASHLLVFTKNSDGEMATGVAVAIVDSGAGPTSASPGLAFTDSDTDAGELTGNLTITRATSEADITDYVLYWGTGPTTKRAGGAISTIAKTGSDVVYSFIMNTSIPTGPTATYLLVYTKNASGEMATPVAMSIYDNTGAACAGMSGMGVLIGVNCWYYGSDGESCATVCANNTINYDAATLTYAGSAGTNANCKTVLDAVLGTSNTPLTNGTAHCSNGVGCGYAVGGGGTAVFCSSNATTDSASAVAFRRACVCN